ADFIPVDRCTASLAFLTCGATGFFVTLGEGLEGSLKVTCFFLDIEMGVSLFVLLCGIMYLGPMAYILGANGGDDEDDDDGDSSVDDADDEDEDEEEEEEYLALADSAVIIPTVELASIPLPPEAEVERLLAIPTPLPSPLTSLSPPSTWERLARIASTQALINAVTVALPSPPLPPLPPPIYIPPLVDCKDDIPKTEIPPYKRSCLFALGSREVSYGIRDTWVDPAEAVPEIPPMTLGEDAQDSRTFISQRVTMESQCVNLLMEDRIAHQETILIVEEEEAYAAREAWAHSIGLTTAAGYSYPDTAPGPNAPPNDNNPNNMTPEFVQAMIDQALLRNSTNGDGSHSSHGIRSLGPDAYAMTWEVLKKKMTNNREQSVLPCYTCGISRCMCHYDEMTLGTLGKVSPIWFLFSRPHIVDLGDILPLGGLLLMAMVLFG
nr:hypothetical protein [Tanacetum cinerariifolium]